MWSSPFFMELQAFYGVLRAYGVVKPFSPTALFLKHRTEIKSVAKIFFFMNSFSDMTVTAYTREIHGSEL